MIPQTQYAFARLVIKELFVTPGNIRSALSKLLDLIWPEDAVKPIRILIIMFILYRDMTLVISMIFQET
jgi:hypothetical protein